MSKYHVRWGVRKDMGQVLGIERNSYDEPWTEDDFLDVLRQRNSIIIVAEDAEFNVIVGYVVYQLKSNSIKICNLAVDNTQRRRGIGKAILDKLKGKTHARRPRIDVMVRDDNLDAQLFLRANGFTCIQCKEFSSDDVGLVFRHVRAGARLPRFKFSRPRE